MAFVRSNLVIAWGGNGRPGPWITAYYHGVAEHPTLWEYDAGSDILSDIEGGSGYFLPDPLMFRHGDLVFVTASNGKALYRVEALIGNVQSGNLTFTKLAVVSSFASDYSPFRAG